MKETLIRIYRWCRRYISLTLIIVVSYIVYMVFFDEHSVLEKMKLQEEIKELKSQIKHYSDSLNYYTKQFQLLNTDVETMEKIVRENYHMQHPDEDVFVFENPNQQ
ncbi:MAG: septum formation initiator family protein [Muribaculaceae bacterium]|nr:septum formation initiator family protein [Muribaculaceae bacterium]